MSKKVGWRENRKGEKKKTGSLGLLASISFFSSALPLPSNFSVSLSTFLLQKAKKSSRAQKTPATQAILHVNL